MLRILVLDNYDSFTFNLVHYLEEILGHEVTVRRNDAIALHEVEHFHAVVLSPGPGLPAEAGIMPQLITQYAASKPILGVCLGHQAIGENFGGVLENLSKVYHGIETGMQVVAPTSVIFEGIPAHFQAGRYHSWVIRKDSLPDAFRVTAVDDNGEIMAIEHRQYPVYGVQFHPESIMTPQGFRMLQNFIHAVKSHTHAPGLEDAQPKTPVNHAE